ncbi:tropinone reductase-like 1 [Cornus florida]|uniref:tropinone reductase-like 1 n=1 Tax=Cornus florida TaxID=4283 RepID=UPI00289E8814|nr:tropinone reductase-like 1 [Cornus florida]
MAIPPLVDAKSCNIASQYRWLEGKVAIITGGANGIGASIVHLFWENGSNKVVIADVQDELGQAISDKLGENVCFIHCEVSKEEDISNLVDTTIAKYGQLDIMHNNAGIVDRHFGNILDTPKSDLDQVLWVNLVRSFLGAKHAARVMVPRDKGCILFTGSACSSIAGLSTHAYAVSKYGVLGLTKNLAGELGQYGIRVNCVSPYAVITGICDPSGYDAAERVAAVYEMGNLNGEILKCEDVAKAALYLASEDANYISGLNLVIDGGFSVVNPTMMRAFGLLQ